MVINDCFDKNKKQRNKSDNNLGIRDLTHQSFLLLGAVEHHADVRQVAKRSAMVRECVRGDTAYVGNEGWCGHDFL